MRKNKAYIWLHLMLTCCEISSATPITAFASISESDNSKSETSMTNNKSNTEANTPAASSMTESNTSTASSESKSNAPAASSETKSSMPNASSETEGSMSDSSSAAQNDKPGSSSNKENSVSDTSIEQKSSMPNTALEPKNNGNKESNGISSEDIIKNTDPNASEEGSDPKKQASEHTEINAADAAGFDSLKAMSIYKPQLVSAAPPGGGKITVNTTVRNNFTDFDINGTVNLKKDTGYTSTAASSAADDYLEDRTFYFKLAENSERELENIDHETDAIIKLATITGTKEYTVYYLGADTKKDIRYYYDELYTKYTGSMFTYLGSDYDAETGDQVINELRDDYYTRYAFNLNIYIIAEEDKLEDNKKEEDNKTEAQKSVRTSGSNRSDRVNRSNPHWIRDSLGWRYYDGFGSRPIGASTIDVNGNRQENYTWIKINNAWWPFASDGYLKTGWFLDPQNNNWYMIDENSGMTTEWYQDDRNNTYYLDPENGSMAVGWKYIDEKWYYFSEIPDSSYGAMYRDTITPDGYLLDENGAWITH